MKRYFVGFLLLSLLLMLPLAMVLVNGQDTATPSADAHNNPHDNERANACFEGGSMAGKCKTRADWDAGWYVIRYEQGLYGKDAIPAWVTSEWSLPEQVKMNPVLDGRANACMEGGSMAGKCETPADWRAGWYTIRYEEGIIPPEDMPADLTWVMPAPVVATVAANPQPDTPTYYPSPDLSESRCVARVEGEYYTVWTFTDIDQGTQAYTDSTCTTHSGATAPMNLVYAPAGRDQAWTTCRNWGYERGIPVNWGKDVWGCQD